VTPAPGEVLAAIATVGLREPDWPRQAPEASDWSEILRGLSAHRLTGLAVHAVESGRFVLDGAQRAELALVDLRTAEFTVVAEATMLALAAELNEERIPLRVLKGSAAAQLDWSLPDRRRYVDTDLLVPGGELGRVIAVAERLGASRRVPELRPGFDRRFAKSVTMDSPRGEVDIHRTLIVGPHAFLVDIDDLWADARGFRVCGHELMGLAAPVATVHYAMHATIAGAQRLGNLRDFVECGQHADLDEAARIARRWQATAVVQQACEHARERLQLGQDHEVVKWGATLAPANGERRVVATYAAGSRTAAALARASLRHVPGLVNKARFAYAIAWTSRSNRSARRRSASDQAARVREHLH